MIYATMCVGSDWINRFKEDINKFSTTNSLHILTDDSTQFNNTASCYEYTRDVFSYYEKIKFILDLSKTYEERITYIDSDWISQYNTNLKYDNSSLYTYMIFDLSSETDRPMWFSDFEIEMRNGKLLNEINETGIISQYIPEALISFPYQENIDELIDDSKKLQTFLESTYKTDTKTNKRLNRYKKGIGYAEGWGMSALCVKYNIDIKDIDWRKKSLV